jgi:quercetin dioxygenase-like cupin family protein
MGSALQAPAWVGFARFTLQAGASTAMETAPGPTLYIGESGTVTFDYGDGQDAGLSTPAGNSPTVGPGVDNLISANTRYAFRNDGGETATLLRVVIHPVAPVIQPAAGVSYQLLVGGVAAALPAASTWATVSRISMAPGASTSTRVRRENGPDLIFVESGAVSLALPGAEIGLSPGDTAVIQANNENLIRDAGRRPAVLLVLALSSAPE